MKKTRTIETYLDGSMSEKERKKTDALLANNEEFSSEMELYRSINESISDDEVFDFRNNIITLFHNKKKIEVQAKPPIMRYLKYPVAATIIALIGFSLFQLLNLKGPEELYSLYYAPYQTDIATRSVINSSDKTQLSYILYQEGNYEVSFDMLSNYLSENLDDLTARFYFALNAIELNKNEIAISELMALEEHTVSPFSLHAKWYLSLLYLKSDQIEEARKHLRQLSDDENYYSEKARKILKKLKS